MELYEVEERFIYSESSKKLKDNKIYLWASDYKEVCPSTHIRLALVLESWARGKSEEEIADEINEECAEGCGFQFLSETTFLVANDHYMVGIFEKKYG